MPAFRINSLTVGYGAKTIINGFSFSINEPALVLICGNNGAGKSSIFKALTGLMPYSGSVSVYSNDVNPENAASFIAALGQDNPVYFDLTVSDLIYLGALGHGLVKSNGYNATGLLEDFDLNHLKNRSLFELSGGERQLAWLAHTKAQNKAIYLLDEPTQHLDIYQRKRMLNHWAQVPETTGKTVLCITHDLPFLSHIPKNGVIWLVSNQTITTLELNKVNLELVVEKLANHSP